MKKQNFFSHSSRKVAGVFCQSQVSSRTFLEVLLMWIGDGAKILHSPISHIILQYVTNAGMSCNCDNFPSKFLVDRDATQFLKLHGMIDHMLFLDFFEFWWTSQHPEAGVSLLFLLWNSCLLLQWLICGLHYSVNAQLFWKAIWSSLHPKLCLILPWWRACRM
jgi:hypothetical protein